MKKKKTKTPNDVLEEQKIVGSRRGTLDAIATQMRKPRLYSKHVYAPKIVS